MGITLPVPLSVQFVVLFVFFFDIGIPYLAHWWITMTQCVAYTRGPDTTLTFALKVKYKGPWHVFVSDPLLQFALAFAYHMHMRRCVQLYDAFVRDDVDFGPHGLIHRVFDIVFCSGYRFIVLSQSNTIFCTWVYPHGTMYHIFSWDNMLCAFMTSVWPWPLAYMWVARVSLVSFTHSFLSGFLVFIVK